ncbi:hypothetical protein [Kitasatospora sp. NPDC002965]|uniref:hypothetical protein n=1 Tax=Kitasatospora sp. NPDC002965 TaxID=3154775 RepID=UPI0033B7DC0C
MSRLLLALCIIAALCLVAAWVEQLVHEAQQDSRAARSKAEPRPAGRPLAYPAPPAGPGPRPVRARL